MAHRFIPLAPATTGVEANAKTAATIAAPAPPKEFQSFAPAAAVSHNAPGHEPKVTVQRDGERITRIQITCSCNQVIDLECVY